MNYKMEELIPVVTWLAKKYTSNESSSVTYEKAQQLMGAVIYCIRMSMAGHSGEVLSYTEKLPAMEAYKAGYEILLKKVSDTMELYHSILNYFDDYQNRCLSDTVLKGIPEFFKWYDTRFNPQDTILTLDYPVTIDMSQYQGINAIYTYLKCIEKEQCYLKLHKRTAVIDILEKYDLEYRDMIDNICSPVMQYYST